MFIRLPIYVSESEECEKCINVMQVESFEPDDDDEEYTLIVLTSGVQYWVRMHFDELERRVKEVQQPFRFYKKN